MKIYRWMRFGIGSCRLVEILFEVMSVRIEDAESKIALVVGRHSILDLMFRAME